MNQVNNLIMRMSRIRFLLVLICVSLGLWIAFTKLVVPSVIESAYRGESLSILNNIIHGQDQHPVDHYLRDWDMISRNITLALLGFGLIGLLIVKVINSPTFFRRCVGEATPGSLGAIRMLTCVILLVSALWEDLASTSLLPREMRQPMGMIQLFYALPIGFERFVESRTCLWIFKWLTALILFLGAIGWRTRIVIPLGAFCYFLLGGILRQYSWFYHTGLIPLYVMAVLSWTPCGDGWSVDRLRKVYRGQAVPAADRSLPVYGWSRYACWLVIALPYVAAGLSKLRNGGLFWWDATNMRSFLFRPSLNPMEFDWGLSLKLAPAPDILFALLGIAAILGELSFGLVLFSRTARVIVPGITMMMHIGILFLQNILFFDLIPLQLVFFDFTKIRAAVGHRLVLSRGPIQVLFDGLCPLCRRTVRLLACLDLFDRLKFLDFRQFNLADFARTHKLDMIPNDLEREMYVISRGQAHRGFYGYRVISLAVPAFWPLAPWLFLPGVSWLGALAYGYVARNHLLIRGDSKRWIESSGTGESTVTPQSSGLLQAVRYPIAVCGITGVLLFCWFYGIESYPFTAMQMFSTTDSSGVIYYFKVFARYESGRTSRAPFEDAIGAMADSRYRGVIRDVFLAERAHVAEKFLLAAASAYNNKTRLGEKVTQFEIQKWRWDFRSNLTDPHHGNMTDRFILEIKAGEGAEERGI